MSAFRTGVCLLVVSTAMFAQSSSRLWNNPPQKYADTADTLTETVPAGTDYWRVTHYGFIRDNGPFQYETRPGNFEAIVRIHGEYREILSPGWFGRKTGSRPDRIRERHQNQCCRHARVLDLTASPTVLPRSGSVATLRHVQISIPRRNAIFALLPAQGPRSNRHGRCGTRQAVVSGQLRSLHISALNSPPKGLSTHLPPGDKPWQE